MFFFHFQDLIIIFTFLYVNLVVTVFTSDFMHFYIHIYSLMFYTRSLWSSKCKTTFVERVLIFLLLLNFITFSCGETGGCATTAKIILTVNIILSEVKQAVQSHFAQSGRS